MLRRDSPEGFSGQQVQKEERGRGGARGGEGERGGGGRWAFEWATGRVAGC